MPTRKKTTRSKPAKKWTAPRHPVPRHCTQEGCAAVLYGPPPPEWLVRGRDILCPQHKAGAVWLDADAGDEPERGRAVRITTDPADANRDMGALPPAYRCPVHDGEIHGGEAEELRAGIEDLLLRYPVTPPRSELIALLDRVNARDSLAYLERQDSAPPQVAPPSLAGIDQSDPEPAAHVDLEPPRPHELPARALRPSPEFSDDEVTEP